MLFSGGQRLAALTTFLQGCSQMVNGGGGGAPLLFLTPVWFDVFLNHKDALIFLTTIPFRI